MYLTHYRLKTKPFQITVDPTFLWLGEKHREAFATLKYGILDFKGFILLTGDIGTGKTVLINYLVTMVGLETIVATIPDPDLELLQFFNFLSYSFKMNKQFKSKMNFLVHLKTFLLKAYRENRNVVLIIDEAQRLNHRLLEEIRLLSNIELYNRKLINIFFVGQSEFNDILMDKRNRALRQRITVRYNLDPLTESETGEYIKHRLNIAGAEQKIFDASAIHEIYRFSGGTPRLINIVCDHALLTGYAGGVKKIDAKIIKECSVDLQLPSEGANRENNQVTPAKGLKPGTGEKSKHRDHSDAEHSKGEVAEPHAGEALTTQPAKDEKKRHPIIKIFYLVFAALLIAVVGYSISHLKTGTETQFAIDDLAPKKYKDSLEKEKKALKAELSKKQTPPENFPGETKTGETKTEETRPSDKAWLGFSGKTPPDETAKEPVLNKDVEIVRMSPEKPAGDTVAEGPAQSSGDDRQEPPAKLKDIAYFREHPPVIHFKLNSNELSDDGFETLNHIAELMIQSPEIKITIKGYSDVSGSTGYNKKISNFRANIVQAYIVARGVDPGNISIVAMGSLDPVASNDTIEGRSLNRRVEIVFNNTTSE